MRTARPHPHAPRRRIDYRLPTIYRCTVWPYTVQAVYAPYAPYRVPVHVDLWCSLAPQASLSASLKCRTLFVNFVVFDDLFVEFVISCFPNQ